MWGGYQGKTFASQYNAEVNAESFASSTSANFKTNFAHTCQEGLGLKTHFQ